MAVPSHQTRHMKMSTRGSIRHLLTGSEDSTKAVFATELKARCKLLGQGKDINEVGILRLLHGPCENACAFDILKEVMWGGGCEEVTRCKGWASVLRNLGADPRAWTGGSHRIHTYYKEHLLALETEIIKSATGEFSCSFPRIVLPTHRRLVATHEHAWCSYLFVWESFEIQRRAYRGDMIFCTPYTSLSALQTHNSLSSHAMASCWLEKLRGLSRFCVMMVYMHY